jgi:hypothetical protein
MMRGRVMALLSVAFLGSTPIGGPLVGWISELAGPRAGLGLGAVAAVATGVIALGVVRSRDVEPVPVEPADLDVEPLQIAA